MSARPRPPSVEAACRSCGGRSLAQIIDLGDQPEANVFPGPADLEAADPTWPLRAFVCDRCWLVQLDDAAPAERSIVRSSPFDVSDTMRDHARRFVEDVLARSALAAPGPPVIELASHGGYLHPFFAERGIDTLIVEGSPELAASAKAAGYRVENRSFDRPAARSLVERLGPVHVVVDNYLLSHVSAPAEFVAGLEVVLAPDGIAVLEFDHVLPMVTRNEFDSLRSGHFSYFSLSSLLHLLRRHGLEVIDVEAQPVYGGALRVFAARASTSTRPVGRAVAEILALEREAGLNRLATYEGFTTRVAAVRDALLEFLVACRQRGQEVVAYGAPSRGNTLLNYCGVTTDLVAYAVDRSPSKQGRFVPGSRVPIYAVGRIHETRPAFVLILTWDLREEVMKQLSEIEDWGGRFVIPLPSLTVLP